ncbi:MAG: hypothetical protein BWY06_01257 [Candidatus Latescibacteria bacterium ADurb.Bin168]|nr:MAG: hypothetical protein BWY06_01257 [Candidatus Latescibacteria bacterium ADurb.Bin168]
MRCKFRGLSDVHHPAHGYGIAPSHGLNHFVHLSHTPLEAYAVGHGGGGFDKIVPHSAYRVPRDEGTNEGILDDAEGVFVKHRGTQGTRGTAVFPGGGTTRMRSP